MADFVYILYPAEADKFYVGSSADPAVRLKKHLARHDGYTASPKDWVIVYREQFESKRPDLEREKVIKSWKSRVKIIDLVSASRP